jgi:hypothetical protein
MSSIHAQRRLAAVFRKANELGLKPSIVNFCVAAAATAWSAFNVNERCANLLATLASLLLAVVLVHWVCRLVLHHG